VQGKSLIDSVSVSNLRISPGKRASRHLDDKSPFRTNGADEATFEGFSERNLTHYPSAAAPAAWLAIVKVEEIPVQILYGELP
jgi:hypothetical protein